MIHNGRSIIQEMQQEGEQKEIENREGKRAARRRRSQRLDFRGGGGTSAGNAMYPRCVHVG